MAIARDTSSTGESLSSTTLTFAHTCTGSNLLLLVGVMCRDGDNVTGVTYGGQALSQLIKRTNGITCYVYGKLSPLTGANDIVVTRTTSTDNLVGIGVSYTDVSQSGLPDATASANITSTTSFALNITTVANNAWAMAFFRADNANNNIIAGAGEVLVNSVGDSGTRRNAVIDTDGPISPAGTETLNASFPAGSNGAVVAVSFAPFVLAQNQPNQSNLLLMGIG